MYTYMHVYIYKHVYICRYVYILLTVCGREHYQGGQVSEAVKLEIDESVGRGCFRV